MKVPVFTAIAATALLPVAAAAQALSAQHETARAMLESPERAGVYMVQVEPGRASEVSILSTLDVRSGPPTMDITYHGEPLTRGTSAGGMTPAFGETALSDRPGETAAASTEGASAPADSEQAATPEDGESSGETAQSGQPDADAQDEG